MVNLNYEEIMNIQENATKKLLTYIDDFFQREKNINSIEFYYPDFDERRTRMAFNVWISLDYKTKYGKNFIEHFLEDSMENLNDEEKEILIERNKSHISLFEIKNIKGDFMYVEDILTNNHHIVWEPELCNIIDKSELIFGRVSKVLMYEKFVGDISFLPDFIKSIFLDKILFDYHLIKKEEPNITIKGYLRRYSLNVYKIYTDCIYEILELDDEENLELAIELDEFETYLNENLSENTVRKHIKNLIAFYDYYLYDKNFSLYDIDKINFEHFVKKGIFDNFIQSQNQLNSYITTLKKYIKFLVENEKIKDFEKAYKDILTISKNRYKYFEPKEPINMPLYWDRQLDAFVRENLNEKAIIFVEDYEKFLFYVKTNNVELNPNNQFINSNHLLKLNNILTNKQTFKSIINVKQLDIPLVHIFYKFSLCNNILTIEKNTIKPYLKEEEYLNLKVEEKLSLFIDYIWNTLSWNELSNSYYDNIEQNYRFEIINSLSQLDIDTIYDYDKVKYKEFHTPIFDNYILLYFNYIGLIRYKENSVFEENTFHTISLSSLGKNIFIVLKENNYKNIKNMGKIIHIKEWKKRK